MDQLVFFSIQFNISVQRIYWIYIEVVVEVVEGYIEVVDDY